MRSGRWKLHFPHRYRTLPEGAEGNNGIPAKYNYRAEIGLSLFDLASDRAESKNVAEDHPEVVERLMKMADEMRAKLGDKLQGIDGSEERPIGTLESWKILFKPPSLREVCQLAVTPKAPTQGRGFLWLYTGANVGPPRRGSR